MSFEVWGFQTKVETAVHNVSRYCIDIFQYEYLDRMWFMIAATLCSAVPVRETNCLRISHFIFIKDQTFPKLACTCRVQTDFFLLECGEFLGIVNGWFANHTLLLGACPRKVWKHS